MMDHMMLDAVAALALVALGGGLGSMVRFWVSGMVARRFGETFPWGTLVVNVTGAAAIGALAAVLMAPTTHAIQNVTVWTGLVVGLLGSYTTVSSFSLQTLALARNGEAGRALANIAFSLALCLGAAAGTWLATSQALALWGAP
jgi:CrcB protein